MNRRNTVITVVLIIAVLIIVSYVSIFGMEFQGKESDFYLPEVSAENVSLYKNSCSELNLSDVSKNPMSQSGKNVNVKGEIFKKEESIEFDKLRSTITLKVPDLSPNPYILVSYSTTIPNTEGDMIEIYGEYYFPARTESIPELANKDIPFIKASYIENI